MNKGKLILIVWLIAGAWLSAVIGCQNPNRPPEDPYLHPPVEVSEDTSGKPPQLLTREQMLEAYNFILDTRENLLVLADYVEQFKEDEDAFIAQRGIFRIKQDEWNTMTKVRLDNFQRSLKSDQPHYARNIMIQALRKFSDEIENYWGHFLRGAPIDPKTDQELLQLLEQANYHLERYQDPGAEKE